MILREPEPALNREQAIRQMAYALWEAEGRPHGRDAHHWTEAEVKIAQITAAVDSGDKPSVPTKAAAKTTSAATKKAGATSAAKAKKVELKSDAETASVATKKAGAATAGAVKVSKSAAAKV